MTDNLLRVYFDSDEIGPDGYPYIWHRPGWARLIDAGRALAGDLAADQAAELLGPERPAVKDYIREQAGNRCERCGHPYEKGMGEWSPCDDLCIHGEPARWRWQTPDGDATGPWNDYLGHAAKPDDRYVVYTEAQWRILTVHHLNGVKHDLRWWNLAALCQRCHLTIQAKVHLDRPYDRPHTQWFKPHAAGYYMSEEEPEPTREWVLENMDEILMLHATQGTLL